MGHLWSIYPCIRGPDSGNHGTEDVSTVKTVSRTMHPTGGLNILLPHSSLYSLYIQYIRVLHDFVSEKKEKKQIDNILFPFDTLYSIFKFCISELSSQPIRKKIESCVYQQFRVEGFLKKE